MNTSEEIVIQMDDDGYRVTTNSCSLETQQNKGITTTNEACIGDVVMQDKTPSTTSSLSPSSSAAANKMKIVNSNSSAPEGFKIEQGNYGEKVYKCNHCEYSSVKKTALLRDHFNHEHKKKVLECTECTYSTLRYKTLQQHRQNRHGLLAMECSFEDPGGEAKCTFRTIIEEVMIDHYLSKHGIQKEPSQKTKEVYDRNILMKYKREGPDGKPVRRPHKHRLDRSQRVFDTTREENEKGGYTYT